MSNQVTLRDVSLRRLFESYTLQIPLYQRIYCWEEQNVLRLLSDLKEFAKEKEYRMGSIILQKKDDKYDIIDGQQRLVTLTLLMLSLEQTEDLPLKDATFQSLEAQSFIAYNRWLIDNYKYKGELSPDTILNNVSFSALILEGTSLDLAYTFFSNQNSRGKQLSDYDLLKAHHLRFIPIEEEAQHLAQRWDAILRNHAQGEHAEEMSQLFDVYLFRLRKWMRKTVVYNNPYHVKQEFEAAPIIKGIPPFGEKFYFYEKMQGGSHFFGYADHFIFKFEQFAKTEEYTALHEQLSGESHKWYRNIIEAFLFAYYLKFDAEYLSEALFCIARAISESRYNTGRMNRQGILNDAGNSELIMMIDQATSPTFFLAEALNIPVTTRPEEPLKGIRQRYCNAMNCVFNQLLPHVSHLFIKSIKEYVYYHN
jgi:hypothetical protein